MPARLSAALLCAAMAGGTVTSPHCAEDFCTWWHGTGEINTQGRVENGNVRQSHRYIVEVAAADSSIFYDSFVYESIPRNGNGKIFSPWDSPDSGTWHCAEDKDGVATPCDGGDGITIEADHVGATMGWSQFEYAQDVDVRIRSRDGTPLDAGGLKIRPTTRPYSKHSVDGAVVIRIPFDSNGSKLSVEFDDDLFEYRSNGTQYVLSGGDVVGVEPINALLIFASPFLPPDMLPRMSSNNTQTMVPGAINNDALEDKPILYFPPGVYWMNQASTASAGDGPKFGENHLRLLGNTYWVHLSPGAYIKGAIEYSTKAPKFYATGHGVLSGEHYVYRANTNTNKGYFYQAVKSDGDSLRMWWHRSVSAGAVWHCVGPTITAPPFNTMDFYPQEHVSVRISDYKQVGAWFTETDGPQMYAGSIVHDVFYHVNDDALKIYYSGVSVSRAIIWKCHNDPIIQMGWSVHDVSDVSIESLNIIHTRYFMQNMYVPTAIIGASPFYNGGKADSSQSISMRISGVTCEGSCPALLRITPLQSFRNFVIEDVNFPDGLHVSKIGFGMSHIVAAEGAPDVTMGLHIKNWRVRGEQVTCSNWQADSLGQLNIDSSYWKQWSLDGVFGPTCIEV